MKSKRMVKGLLLGVILVCVTLPCFSHAIPQKIYYQGYLTTQEGVPINETLLMAFSLYNDPTSGFPLWTEDQNVTVINGIYNVSLGETIPIPLPFDVPYYLGITVGSDPEMTPRKALTSVGYAFRAMTADVVGAHTDSGADITSGTVAEPRIDSVIARTSALNAHTSNMSNPHSTTAARVGAVALNQTNSITSAKSVDGAVRTNDLTNSSVTKPKLSASGGTGGQVLATDDSYAVVGGGYGVYGSVSAGTGVFGHSYYNYGMFAESQQGTGMTARHINTGNYADIGTANAAIRAVAVSGGNTAIISQGDLVIEGGLNSFRGTVGPNNGAPFPRPAYDSGWLEKGSGSYNYNYNTNLPTYTYNYENFIVDVKLRLWDGSINGYIIFSADPLLDLTSVYFRWWIRPDNIIGTLAIIGESYGIRIRVWHIN